VKGGSDPTKLLGGFTVERWGRSHTDLVFLFCDFSIRDVAHPLPFLDSYLLHGVKKSEKRKVQ
jgi:hypothetical protein